MTITEKKKAKALRTKSCVITDKQETGITDWEVQEAT